MNVMVCDPGATVIVFVTIGAAEYLGFPIELPAWLAATSQLPAASRVSVVPLAVQMLGVVEAKATVKPDVEVATKGAGATPKVWLPGESKVMVWAVSSTDTVKVFDTTGAAA